MHGQPITSRAPVRSHEWLVAFHVGRRIRRGPSGGALFIVLMLLVLDVTVDQCAEGEVTAEMQKQRERETRRGGSGGRVFGFAFIALRCVDQFSATVIWLTWPWVQPRDTECVGKRPPRWPKDHQSPAWRGARRRPENTQRSAGALDWWKLVWQARRRRAPDWPAGLSRGCGAVGRWGRSRLCRQSGPAGSFRAAHPCAAYAPVKRNGCALPLAGPRGHQPVSPTFCRLTLPGGQVLASVCGT